MSEAILTRRAALAGIGASLLLPAGQAGAQQFPTRPVKWIVGYPAGGGTDVLARLLAATMETSLGQPIVVENLPGAATNIAAAAAARAEPDGHTLFSAAVETLVYNPVLYRKLQFDPDKDFRPIGLAARFHLLLTVRPDSPARSAAELVGRAKAEPETISYGSPGLGSPHHVAMERLLKETDAKMTHVPYRGMAPVITGLLAGEIEAAVVDFAAGQGPLKDGSLRPLAVASAQRPDALPDVPTVQEALALSGFEAYSWQGVVVPAQTPDPIAARLSEVLSAAVQQPSVRERMVEIGLDPLAGGPTQFDALLKAERGVWEPIIKGLGLTLD